MYHCYYFSNFPVTEAVLFVLHQLEDRQSAGISAEKDIQKFCMQIFKEEVRSYGGLEDEQEC